MRFGQFLLENMVSEWKLFYIDYHKLKKLLKTFKKNFLYITHKTIKDSKLTNKSFKLKEMKSDKIKRQDSIFINDRNNSKFQISLRKKKITFYRQLCIELYKVKFFYDRNMSYYKNKLNKIEKHLSIISKYENLSYLKINYENAIKELYKEMGYMNRYIDLNLQAKRKIIKKFNKYIQSQDKEKENLKERSKSTLEQEDELKTMLEYVNNTIISSDLTKISNTEADIEKLFRQFFFDKYLFNYLINLTRIGMFLKRQICSYFILY